MDDFHSETEKNLIVEILETYTQKLIDDTVKLIHQAERNANQKFAENSLSFESFSPANADYLTAALHEALFDRLHKGNTELAKLILTMNGKRVGAYTEN